MKKYREIYPKDYYGGYLEDSKGNKMTFVRFFIEYAY
jgi:hypothetical protein